MSSPRHRRGGFSLLEVILGLAILMGTIAVLGEIARSGIRSAQSATDLTRAQLLCESTMAALAAGIIPAESVADVPVESDMADGSVEWEYSIYIQPVIDEPDMLEASVTVRRNPDYAAGPVEFTLVRWIADPDIEAAEEEAEALGPGGIR